MSKVLKVGLIGCGNVVSYGHRPALTTLQHVELVALADITPARREIGQEWFSLNDDQLYEDYKDVLAIDAIDAVVITVPQKFRRQIVLDALSAGKHVLSEKPISDVPAVASELIQAVEGHAPYLGIPRSSKLDSALVAVDELTGLIMAVGYVRPSKDLRDVRVRSVRKKWKDKRFAAAISREEIEAFTAELGEDLTEHIGFVLAAMQGIAGDLGLDGIS